MKVVTACVWQLDGQWWRMIAQLNAEAGSAPSSASVACPEKLIRLPTLQVVVATGVSITAVGGVLGVPTVTKTEAVPVAPWLSVTFSRAW